MSQQWEYRLVPLGEAGSLKRSSDGITLDRLNGLGADGWEAVGLSLKKGDLVAWPVVLMKRPVRQEPDANQEAAFPTSV